MAIKESTAARNAKLDTLTASVGTSAYIRLYDGTRPAGVATSVTTQTLLAELRGNASAFAGAASGGVLNANAITSATAAASGTATWFRILKSDGTTAVIDGAVGTSGADLNLPTTAIVSGQTISCSAMTITDGNG